MKFQQKKLALALAHALGGAALIAGAPAIAADVRVDVTGSNIKRVESETALPVQVITADDIQKSGVQSTNELVSRISANQTSGTFNEITGVGTSLGGFSGVSLRGLGVERSLVLLNGRRISSYSIAGAAVDLNAIPITAIERVEILKDGASAIYGSDAVAGVVNFIMRKDFTGIDAYAYYGDSESGGGKQWRGTLAAGWGDLTKDKVNVFGLFDYVKTDPIKALDRDFSKTVYRPDIGMDSTSANSIPANIAQSGGFTSSRNPGVPGCLPPFSLVTTNPNTCRFDFGATINITPPTEKTTALGRLTWQINPDNQFFAEGSWYEGKFTYAISPTPVNGAILGPIADGTLNLFPSSPFYPTAFVASLPGGRTDLPVQVSWRMTDTGPRTNENIVNQYRALAGLQGTIKGWDYSTAVNWNENRIVDNYTRGYIDAGRFLTAWNTGTLNPFAANTGAALELLGGTQSIEKARETTGSTLQWDGRVSNDIYKLPAGPLALALGGEWRKETLEQAYSDNYIAGNYVGGAGAIPPVADKDRTVYAGFLEFNIPIVKTLEANVAVRYDHYSDFGSTVNPKASIRWQPNSNLLFRGAWGTGFRAPSLSDLFQPQLLTNTGGNYSDPLRCPITQSTVDCDLQYNISQGGNPLLKPEKSTNWTVGAIFSPTVGFSVGVDYYNIEIKDVIVLYPELAAVTPYLSQPTTGFTPAGLGVARRPVQPDFPNLPGPIDFFGDPLFNLGSIKTSGIDIDVMARGPSTALGRFTASLSGTYVISFKESDPATGEIKEIVGTRTAGLASSGATGAVQRWRHYASLNWAYGPWNATVSNSYQHGYTEYPETAAAEAIFGASRRVASYSLWDVQGQFQGFKNITLTLGIKNLMDTDPPLSIVNQGFVLGWDKLAADPMGRFFYGSIRYAFK